MWNIVNITILLNLKKEPFINQWRLLFWFFLFLKGIEKNPRMFFSLILIFYKSYSLIKDKYQRKEHSRVNSSKLKCRSLFENVLIFVLRFWFRCCFYRKNFIIVECSWWIVFERYKSIRFWYSLLLHHQNATMMWN